jgi:hypothetical protein
LRLNLESEIVRRFASRKPPFLFELGALKSPNEIGIPS